MQKRSLRRFWEDPREQHVRPRVVARKTKTAK